MTTLQIYLLVAPVVLVAVCGGLAWYAGDQADRSTRAAAAKLHPAE